MSFNLRVEKLVITTLLLGGYIIRKQLLMAPGRNHSIVEDKDVAYVRLYLTVFESQAKSGAFILYGTKMLVFSGYIYKNKLM